MDDTENPGKPGKNPAGSAVHLVTGREQCSRSAAEILQRLADRAKAGEVTGFAGIVETGPTYETHCSTTMSRTQTAGALIETAMVRLGFVQQLGD